jgi:hypothetical protein
MTTYALTTPVSGLPFDMRQTFAGEYVMLKNAYVGYLLTLTGCTQIADTDYPSYHSYAVTSITRVGSTATVTTTATNTLETGNTVVIAGAAETEYNGTFTVTVTVPGSVFTYTVTGTPATPATGTITANGGWTTVPGIVYLDDYLFVQRVDGEIQNCNRSTFATWDALDFITPEKEPSLAVCIAKSLNFLVAFKQWDTEFFYNAEQDPPGSPLLPQESAYLKLGCASAQSVVEFDGGIAFISQRDQLQRSREVHVLNGLTPKKISKPPIERLLNDDDLATVYSLYLSTAGHQLYVLTLVTSGITLVYDFGNEFWYNWTTLTAQSSKPVISLTSDGTTATASVNNHGYSDGDPVLMAGATPSDYNGTFNITYVDENTFTYVLDAAATSPATGTITAVGYTESYMPIVAYASYQNLDLVLHQSNGIIYALDSEYYQDTDVPINVLLRLPPWDGGNKYRKTFSHAKPIGDIVEATALLRHSDDDYDSWSKYRRVSMASNFSMLRKLGQGRRRAWELRYTENEAGRWEAIDQDFRQGF